MFITTTTISLTLKLFTIIYKLQPLKVNISLLTFEGRLTKRVSGLRCPRSDNNLLDII